MSTDEAASPDPSPTESSPAPSSSPPKQRSVLRIILFAILAVAVIALVFDQSARTSSQGLKDSLEQLLNESPANDRPTITAVHEKIGREPAASYDEENGIKVEEYRYRGALRNYVVYVYYKTLPQTEGEERLYSVSINTKDEF